MDNHQKTHDVRRALATDPRCASDLIARLGWSMPDEEVLAIINHLVDTRAIERMGSSDESIYYIAHHMHRALDMVAEKVRRRRHLAELKRDKRYK